MSQPSSVAQQLRSESTAPLASGGERAQHASVQAAAWTHFDFHEFHCENQPGNAPPYSVLTSFAPLSSSASFASRSSRRDSSTSEIWTRNLEQQVSRCADALAVHLEAYHLMLRKSPRLSPRSAQTWPFPLVRISMTKRVANSA